MGKGGWIHPDHSNLDEYSWEEIGRHASKQDRWIAVDGYVYDVTKWARRHPGGEKIIHGYAGQDASEAWYAFHIDKVYVNKFMHSILIGRVKEDKDLAPPTKQSTVSLLDDFRALRMTAENAGYFRPNPVFYVAVLVHIVILELIGWGILKTYGTGWIPCLVAAMFLATAQVQAGWSQHDYGHLSVFKKSRLNHWAHIAVINVFKGASSDWWNYRHFNHHSKPNILMKDPDIRFAPLFLVGNAIATEYGQKKRRALPYQMQHKYFFFILPPLLLPLYFNFEIPYYLITRRRWAELFWMATFFVRWQLMFSSIVGVWGVLALFMFVRFLESHWFVWATQMSHLPMKVDYDGKHDWVTTQLDASCNVEHSLFNDWFSGHLNFQIEHHLFPTMPRHNLVKVAPLVKSLCIKHNLTYQCKPMMTAFKDIVQCLKTSGEAWCQAYEM